VASTSGYRRASTYNKEGGYSEPRQEHHRSDSYGSHSYTFERPVDSRTSELYDDPKSGDWKQDSDVVDPLTSGVSSLSIGQNPSSQLPLSTPALSNVPNSYPPTIPEDSRGTDPWESSAAANDQGMLSVPYQDKGKVVVANYQPKLRRVQGDRLIAHTRESGKLDPLYKVRNHDYKDFFRQGKVFSTLWTTPFSGKTNHSNDSENQFMSNVTYTVYGEKVHSKIRRFVVVRQAKNRKSCTCIPITTYSNQGGEKFGIDLEDHGLIFSSRKPPARIDGIDKEPLRVILSKDGEELTNPSLVDYRRVYTVECNVKVKEVGDIERTSRSDLRRYFKDAFEDSDDFEDRPEPQTPQARDGALAGIGGAGSQPYQDYANQQSAPGFVPSSRIPSSYPPDQVPSYTPQGRGWTSSTTTYPPASQSSYTAPADYSSRVGPNQPLRISSIDYSQVPSYDPNRSLAAPSAYPSDARYIPSSSSTGGNTAPSAPYREPSASSSSSWYPAAGTIPHGHIDSRPYPGSNPPPAGNYSSSTYGASHDPARSTGAGAYYSSGYAPVDSQPLSSPPGYTSSSAGGPAYYDDRDIDLNDSRPHQQRRGTTRPPHRQN
jgi:hypothetical protein